MKYEELHGETPAEFFLPIVAEEAGRYELWHCNQCRVLFEKEDMILERMVGSQKSWFACPLRKKKQIKFLWFKREIVEFCLNRLEGWDADFFEREHEVEPKKPKEKVLKESPIFG